VVPFEGSNDGQSEPNAHAGVQSASGVGGTQGRPDHQPSRRALPASRQPRGALEEAIPRRAAAVFTKEGKNAPLPDDPKLAELYEQIGRLQVELAFAKKISRTVLIGSVSRSSQATRT
jgi:hypothetical protein